MGGDRLREKLERLHGTDGVRAGAREALEQDLLLRYRKTHPKRRRWLSMLNLQTRVARFAVAGLAVLLLGVAACSTETTTEVEVGKQLRVDLAGTMADKSIDIDQRLQEVVQLFSELGDVEDVSVNIEQDGEGNITLNMMLVGEGLESELLSRMIRDAFPEIPDANVFVEAVEGTITESWAERFGREVFHLEMEGSSPEEIRAQVLQQLADQGFDGDAEVIVSEDGDQQMIEIRLTEDVEVDQ